MPRTRIVATLGPASDDDATVTALIDAGVNVFRLNFSHGTHPEHGARIARIRRLAGSQPVAILQDLCGPKLRLRHPVRGDVGEVIQITLPANVQPGDPVLLADGIMQLEVVDATHARVLVAGDIPAGKGINLPSSRLDLPSLTQKDAADLAFGVAQGVDLVALSFVRCAADLVETQRAGLPVIAKIETADAVRHLEEIVAAADGIMIARGDLGVEIPIERVPIVQKQLIALANRAGKPVITATQMLRSMVESLVPTRAEATDVANAVLDGTDGVMLSEETAIGRHPVAAVRTMARIAREVESYDQPHPLEPRSDTADLIARAACDLAARLGAAAIVVPTTSGFTARQVARHRPHMPIIALTPNESVRRRLSLTWGITAVTAVPPHPTLDTTLDFFRAPVRATGLVPAGARVVLTIGWPFGQPSNLVHATTL
jgi:pyruvate kinase